MHIRELVNESKEAKAIFTDFAGRQRVHVHIPVHLSRFYSTLFRKDRTLRKDNFNKVFTLLARMGYGSLETNTKGYMVFNPSKPIKAIGKEALEGVHAEQEDKPLEELPSSKDNVVVLFKLHGLRCRAEIPKEALDDFETLVNA